MIKKSFIFDASSRSFDSSSNQRWRIAFNVAHSVNSSTFRVNYMTWQRSILRNRTPYEIFNNPATFNDYAANIDKFRLRHNDSNGTQITRNIDVGVLRTMTIVVGYGIGDLSSSPVRSTLHFISRWCPWGKTESVTRMAWISQIICYKYSLILK